MDKARQASEYLSQVPTKTVSLGGFAVHYLDRGEGRPLILVHGGGMWLYSYRHNVGDLSRDFRVCALDMPGYGYTEPLGRIGPMGPGTMSETLLKFMDALGIGSAVLVGHSWGGGWALHFAARHPSRVDGLVLIDSSGLNVRDVPEWELLKVPVLGPLLLRCVTPRVVAKRLERSYFLPGMVTPDLVREVLLPLRFGHNRRIQALISRDQDWRETEEALPGIRQPVLVIWGDRDRYLDAGLVSRFLQALPRAEAHILRNCGHSPHEEFPGEANALIAAFAKKAVCGTR